MKELLEIWIVSLVLMVGSGFFLYRTLKIVIEHVKNYREHKTENLILSWYFDWLYIFAEVFLGSFRRPSVVISLLFFLMSTIGLIVNTIKIIARLLFFSI